MHVYKAIAAVMADIASEGIAKSKRNAQQGYNFRGIDDVYNALSPILSKHGLCVLPRVLSRDVVERTTTKGGAIFYVTVEAEFDFIAAEDGTKHTVKTFGEAMDSADKATNKAMSAAYKYAAMQAFCIPTEGDNDADASTHEVAPRRAAPAESTPFDAPDWVAESRELSALINSQPTLQQLGGLWATDRVKAFIRNAPADLSAALVAVKDSRKDQLSNKEAA